MEKIQELNALIFKQIEEKIDNLSTLQSKHNSTIERTYALEKTQAELTRDSKTLYNHVDELKADIREIRGNVDDLGKAVNDLKNSEARLEEKINN